MLFRSTTEDTCEYFERGLLELDEVHTSTPLYLQSPCDPMDDDGNVLLPDGAGLGYDLNWDYIDTHRITR